MSGSLPPSYGGKPVSSKLDYAYDFTGEIAKNEPGDTISISQIALDPADGSLEVSSISASAGVVTFWLSGGIQNQDYVIHVIVQTAGGRVITGFPFPIVMVV